MPSHPGGMPASNAAGIPAGCVLLSETEPGVSLRSTTTATGKKSQGFTDEDRAAMKERAQELKGAARADKDEAAGESDVLAKISVPSPNGAEPTEQHTIHFRAVGLDSRFDRRTSRYFVGVPRLGGPRDRRGCGIVWRRSHVCCVHERRPVSLAR